jgi:hypothetical protein
MSYKSFVLTLVLTFGIFLVECKKDSVPPTDEEILGNIVKPEIIDVYIYPIRPGTPEWGTLTSYDQMLAAIKLPDSILHSISTWGLVMTCFNYPLSGDYFAHNNQVAYMNDLSQSFNGLKELFSREDISTILLYNYRHMDFSLYPSFIDRHFIELLIGCNAYLSKLNQRQLQYLVSVALEKANYQRAHFESSFPPYSYFIMANAMIHYGYKPFINYCSTNTENSSTEIFFWGINAEIGQIEKYAVAFVND